MLMPRVQRVATDQWLQGAQPPGQVPEGSCSLKSHVAHSINERRMHVQAPTPPGCGARVQMQRARRSYSDLWVRCNYKVIGIGCHMHAHVIHRSESRLPA